jgi:single-strand DNA-binding protein
MNRFFGIGRLTADPQITVAQSGTKIARYTLAINRPKKPDGTQEADFLNCKAFGKTAEFVERFLKKGIKIAVNGTLQTGSYTKDGVTHYTTDVIVNEHEFCESRNGAETQSTASVSVYTNTQTAQTGQYGEFYPVTDDFGGDLPF